MVAGSHCLIYAGGVHLFPYIRLFAPFRHYVIGFAFIALFAYQTSQLITPENTQLQTNDPRLADVVAYESLLSQKAQMVMDRADASSYTIDLSVELDHTRVTTTTFDPSDEHENGGVWKEEVTTSPRVRCIKVIVTLTVEDELNKDQLFQNLTGALGLKPERGDTLRLAEF